MTRGYRMGNRVFFVSAEAKEGGEPITSKIMDTWIFPVMRREEKRETADTMTAEDMTECLQFIQNGGRHRLVSVVIRNEGEAP